MIGHIKKLEAKIEAVLVAKSKDTLKKACDSYNVHMLSCLVLIILIFFVLLFSNLCFYLQ